MWVFSVSFLLYDDKLNIFEFEDVIFSWSTRFIIFWHVVHQINRLTHNESDQYFCERTSITHLFTSHIRCLVISKNSYSYSENKDAAESNRETVCELKMAVRKLFYILLIQNQIFMKSVCELSEEFCIKCASETYLYLLPLTNASLLNLETLIRNSE